MPCAEDRQASERGRREGSGNRAQSVEGRWEEVGPSTQVGPSLGTRPSGNPVREFRSSLQVWGVTGGAVPVPAGEGISLPASLTHALPPVCAWDLSKDKNHPHDHMC